MSQIVTSNSSRSQIVILKRGQNIKYLPYAFTEQGIAMLSCVLRSPQAILINIEIMRSFIRLRQTLASHKEMSKDLTELKSFLLKHSNQTNREFKRVWDTIEKLAKPINDKNRGKIGFHLD